jgi:hypothetical protein
MFFLLYGKERFELERRRRDARHLKSTSQAMGDWSGGEYVKTAYIRVPVQGGSEACLEWEEAKQRNERIFAHRANEA